MVSRRLAVALVIGLAGLPGLLGPITALAGPPTWVIPPGRQQLARELLADVPAGPLTFGGPSIEKSTIRFGLYDADKRELARVLLAPRTEAGADEPTSTSFVIRTARTEGVTLDKAAQVEVDAMLAAALASIRAHDEGGFYTTVAIERPLEPPPDPEDEHEHVGGPALAVPPEWRDEIRRRWALELAVLSVTLAGATAVLLRPRRPGSSNPER